MDYSMLAESEKGWSDTCPVRAHDSASTKAFGGIKSDDGSDQVTERSAREWEAAIAAKRQMLQWGSGHKDQSQPFIGSIKSDEVAKSSDGENPATNSSASSTPRDAPALASPSEAVVEVAPGQKCRFGRTSAHVYHENCKDGELVEVVALAADMALQNAQVPPVQVRWASGFTSFVHYENLHRPGAEGAGSLLTEAGKLEMVQMRHALMEKEAEMLKLQIEMAALKQNMAQPQDTQPTQAKDVAPPPAVVPELAAANGAKFSLIEKNVPAAQGESFSVESLELDFSGMSRKSEDKAQSAMSSMPLHQIVDTMLQHPGSFDLWTVGCVLLVEAVEASMQATSTGTQPDREVLSKIVNVGGVAVALKYVRAHIASDEAVALGLRLLSLLAVAVANAEHLVVDLGCGALVVEALGVHEGSAEVQSMGCLVVGALAAGDPKVASSLLRLGAGKVVIEALQSKHGNQDSSHNACQAIGLLADTEDDATVIIELGGIDALHSALRQCGSCPRIQDRAVFAFHRLAAGVEAISHIFADDGIRLLEKAMRENISSAPLQVRGCQLLAAGARDVDGVADKIVDLGGAEAVRAVALAHSSSELVQEASRHALESIALELSVGEEVDDLAFFPPPGLADHGGDDAAPKASRVQPRAENGPIAAAAPVGAAPDLSEADAWIKHTGQPRPHNSSGNEVAVQMQGMPVQAIIEMMTAHEESLEVLAGGCQHFIEKLEGTLHTTPTGILQVDASAASRLGSMGVVACALFLGRCHIANPAAVAMAFHLLSLLAVGVVNSTYLVHDLRCGELVAQAMCLHHDSGQVQSRGCGVIGALSAKSHQTSRALVRAGCAGAVITAICGRHSKDCSHSGCQALFSLSSDELTSCALVQMGCIKAVFAAMRDHSKNRSVQGWAGMALFKLTSDPEALAQIITAEGVKLLAEAMSVRRAIAQLQVCGCKLLGAGAQLLDGGAAIVVDHGGLDAVMWAMSAHVDSKPIQDAGRHAMQCITTAYQWGNPLAGVENGEERQRRWSRNAAADQEMFAGAASSSAGNSAAGEPQSIPHGFRSFEAGGEMQHRYEAHAQASVAALWHQRQQQGQFSAAAQSFVPPPGLNVDAQPFQPGQIGLAAHIDAGASVGVPTSTLGKPMLSRLLPVNAPVHHQGQNLAHPSAPSEAFDDWGDVWGPQTSWARSGGQVWGPHRTPGGGYQKAMGSVADSGDAGHWPNIAAMRAETVEGAQAPGLVRSTNMEPALLAGEGMDVALRSQGGLHPRNTMSDSKDILENGSSSQWFRDAEHMEWGEDPERHDANAEGSDSEDFDDDFDAEMSECPMDVEPGVHCECCGKCHGSNSKKLSARPTRGKRNRYRCLVTNLMRQVDADPANFALEDSRLPPSIASNEFMKTKLEAKMALYVAARFAELESTGQSPLAPGAAAEKKLLAERAMQDVAVSQAMLKQKFLGNEQMLELSDDFPSDSVDMALLVERLAT